VDAVGGDDKAGLDLGTAGDKDRPISARRRGTGGMAERNGIGAETVADRVQQQSLQWSSP